MAALLGRSRSSLHSPPNALPRTKTRSANSPLNSLTRYQFGSSSGSRVQMMLVCG